jgi:hypothetical protein
LKTVKVQERVPSIDEMRARLNLDSYIRSDYDANALYNDNIKNQEEMKKRKAELINGQKNLIKGINNNTNTSCYQEVFK